MDDEKYVPQWYRHAADGPSLLDLTHADTLAYVISGRRLAGGGFHPTLFPAPDDPGALSLYYYELGAALGHGPYGATIFLKIAAFEPGRSPVAPILGWPDTGPTESSDHGGVYAAYGSCFAVVQDDSGSWHRYGVGCPAQGRVQSIQALADMTGRTVVVGRRIADVDLY